MQPYPELEDDEELAALTMSQYEPAAPASAAAAEAPSGADARQPEAATDAAQPPDSQPPQVDAQVAPLNAFRSNLTHSTRSRYCAKGGIAVWCYQEHGTCPQSFQNLLMLSEVPNAL